MQTFCELSAEFTKHMARYGEDFVGEFAKTATNEVEGALDQDSVVFAKAVGVAAHRLTMMFPYEPPLGDLKLLDVFVMNAPLFHKTRQAINNDAVSGVYKWIRFTG